MIELLSFGPGGWGSQFLGATLMTAALALGGFALGLPLGALAAAARLWGGGLAGGLALGYTTLVRGVPELLVVYLLFFGGGEVVAALGRAFGLGGLDAEAFVVGVLAIGVISGAYAAEVIRGAVTAVPRGQIEAARAQGMGFRLALVRIIAPQALVVALPGLGNVWQATLKDTALVSVTALAEIMRVAHVAAGSTRQPFVFYALAAILYLLLTTVSGALFAWGQRSAGWPGVGVAGKTGGPGWIGR